MSDSGDKTQSNCIFCNIANGRDTKTNLLFQDDRFAVFCDIRPASKHHYLVVPRDHIVNVAALNGEQIDLVGRLIEIGRRVLLEQGGDESDVRLGFHRPPFTSVSHLHLHVIAPTVSMGFIHRLIFRPNSWWFTAVDIPKNNSGEPAT